MARPQKSPIHTRLSRRIKTIKRILHSIATLGFIGYLPKAPGSFGTLPPYLLVMLFRPDDIPLLIFSAFIFLLGVLSAHQAERVLGKDSGHIVIDEFCGYLISVLFLPKTLAYLTAAFILFRFFDILKPTPIRMIEKTIPGGAGVMMDDVLAGIYANICLQVWRYLY
ncbi:MAG: phosphatidylglycerophosphatase A [Nitrospirota bacterium]